MSATITSGSVQVGIVGAGISGLTLAYRLAQARPDWHIRVWETEDRCGGVLYTKTDQGCAVELGADSFLVTPELPWAADLARELGLGDDLVDTAEPFRRAHVVRRGQLVLLPTGFQLLTPGGAWSTLTSPLLSLRGKLRLLCEPWIPRRTATTDESLASFATRRLGREVFERIVEPLVGGIYTADANLLSMQAALPQFVKQEQEYGSLTRAALARRQATGSSGARYALFQAPRSGLGAIPRALANRLNPQSLELGRTVRNVARRAEGGWKVRFADGGSHDHLDAIAFCTPAHVVGSAIRDTAPPLAARLDAIPYASSAVVHLVYHKRQFVRPLDSFGFVVPSREGLSILAGSFSSVKFPQRALPQHEVIRVFFGGAIQEHVLDHDDDTLIRLAREGLQALLPIYGRPIRTRIMRWYRRMPQFHLDHKVRIAELQGELAKLPGLYLAGNYLAGVGIPQCIRTASEVAQKMVQDWSPASAVPNS